MKTTLPSEKTRLAVSRARAADLFDCSIDYIDDLLRSGQLERVQIGKRRLAVTWRSISGCSRMVPLSHAPLKSGKGRSGVSWRQPLEFGLLTAGAVSTKKPISPDRKLNLGSDHLTVGHGPELDGASSLLRRAKRHGRG